MKKILIPILILCGTSLLDAQNTWTRKADMPTLFSGRAGAFGFSIGTKGYVGGGRDSSSFSYVSDFWEWDQSTDTWTQKANFGGGSRFKATSFEANGKGYAGMGSLGETSSGPYLSDLWEYDPGTNSWTQKTNFPGGQRTGMVSCSMQGKGYVGMGESPYVSPFVSFHDDWWEYDPSNDTWTQKTNFPGSGRCDASAFSISNLGYVGFGMTDSLTTFMNDLWCYDPSNDTWTQKSSLPGPGRSYATSFAANGIGFVGTGIDAPNAGGLLNDFWEYFPGSDGWFQVANFFQPRFGSVGFSIGNYGYLATGYRLAYIYNQPGEAYDLWEYSPCSTPPPAITASDDTICSSDSILLTSNDTGGTHQWFFNGDTVFGATQQTYWASQSGQYTVTNNCSPPSVPFNLTIVNFIATVSPDITISCGDTTQLSVATNFPVTYSWYPSTGLSSTTVSNPFASPGSTTTYSVLVTAGPPCNSSQTGSVTVQVENELVPSICIVTVDQSTNKNVIVWEQLNSLRITSYNIYKETTQAGIYALIGNVPKTSFSTFTDNSSNPQVRADRYKISTVDTCGLESELGATAHKTIHLSINKGMGGNNNLIWDDYEGFPVSQFKIYRGNNYNNLILLDSIQGNLFSYTDTHPQGKTAYAIVVVNPNGCNPSVRILPNALFAFGSSMSNIEGDLDPSCSFFPNPFSDVTTVKLEGVTSADLVIYDVLGNIVLSEKLEKESTGIERGTLTKGMYFYQVTNEGVVVGTGKLIVE